MIKLPLPQIIDKISQEKSLDRTQIEEMIKQKMDELSGLISEEGAAHIIANELGVKLFQAQGTLKIKDILPGMRNIETLGKVTALYEVREFNTGSRQGKVGNFMIGDDTGKIRVTVWNEMTDKMKEMQEGSVIKIKSGYVRENQRGYKELHLNDNSAIVLNPPGIEVEVKEGSSFGDKSEKKINELQEGDMNAEIKAHIIDIYAPVFFEVCPECGKRARMREDVYVCQEHGQVTPTYSYVINLFLDDGSGRIRTACFKNQADQILEDVISMKDNLEKFEMQRAALMGQKVQILGRATRNTMSNNLEFTANIVTKEASGDSLGSSTTNTPSSSTETPSTSSFEEEVNKKAEEQSNNNVKEEDVV